MVHPSFIKVGNLHLSLEHWVHTHILYLYIILESRLRTLIDSSDTFYDLVPLYFCFISETEMGDPYL